MKALLKQLIAHRPSPLAVQTAPRVIFPQAAPLEESQEDMIERHLRGELRVGAYTTIPGASLVRWCCFDLDGGGHADNNALEDPDLACELLEQKLLASGVPVLRERSGGGGGWHLWVVFDKLMDAADVRDWMRQQLRGLDVRTRSGRQLDPDAPKGIELFPKQDTLADGDHGNLVWLPGWGQAPDPHIYHKGQILTDHLPVYTLNHKAPERVKTSATSPNVSGVREKDVKSWLACLDPDDYELWLKVGMSLHTWTKTGGGDGLNLWVLWSKGSPKFEAGACEVKWDSFRKEAGGVTVASLRYWAKSAGWCEIKRGSHVEIADHLLDGEVFDGADLYRFEDSRGVWERVSLYDFERRVCDLDGLEIPPREEKGKPKTLNVSADMASSVAKVATRRAQQIDPSVWTARTGFAVANGWVTPTGLEPLTKEHYARHQLNVGFNPAARAPRWMQFLAESVDAESALILQEFVGAALFGDATTYQKALVLWGEGNNGKSVFAKTVSLLFDESALSSYTPHAFNDNGTKADLRLRRLNVVMELPERELLDTGSIKAIFTGDSISARRPYDVEPITFKPKCAHLYCCNLLPDTRNTDNGFWRRWITIGFNRTPAVVDPYLPDKLAGELAGIVAWAVAGYVRLQEQGGYTKSTSAEEVKADWQLTANPVLAFVQQVLEPDPNAATSSIRVYEAFTRWCELTKRKPYGTPKFGAEIKKHIQQGRDKNGSHYHVRVKAESAWQILP